VLSTHPYVYSLGIESRWERDFRHPSRLALWPIQHPIQWVVGPSPGGKVARAWHWSPTPHLAQRLNSRAIPLLPHWVFVACSRVNFTPLPPPMLNSNSWAFGLNVAFSIMTLWKPQSHMGNPYRQATMGTVSPPLCISAENAKILCSEWKK